MNRIVTAFLCTLTTAFAACGGGGGGGSLPPPVTPPAPSGKAHLTATNYQDAVKVTMGTSYSVFSFARIGVTLATGPSLVPPPAMPPFPCPGGGTAAVEYSDGNHDGLVTAGDQILLRWDHCLVQGTETTGLVQTEYNALAPVTGGTDYQLTVTIVDMRITTAGVPTAVINLIAPVHFTRTVTQDHYRVAGATFGADITAGHAGISVIAVDYLQDYATQTYSYAINGTVDGLNLGGTIDFATPAPFTGALGEYPALGRVELSGEASTARLSEEGAAAADGATAYIAVDANADGTQDVANAAYAWSEVLPVQAFAPFAQVTGTGIPVAP